MKIFTQELFGIELNASSSARTVYLAKAKAIAHLLNYATTFLATISCHATKELGNLNVLYNKTKNPVELKQRQTSSSYRIFHLMPLKPQKER